MRNDRPLTLTVEQAGRLLGVGRSTTYELVRTGELECLRLRRRLVIPTARVAERLGVQLADVWNALEAHSASEEGRPSEASALDKLASGEPRQASVF